ncbi:MAG: TolC family protein [Burkholderiaceae bacterium]
MNFPQRCAHARARAFICLLPLTLLGCANFSADGGLNRVSELSRERIGYSVPNVLNTTNSSTVEARISTLLSATLSSDSVVEITVLNHPRLRVALADLGIAEADLVQAGRLRNPGFSFGRLSGNGEVEIDRAIMFDLSGLLSMPLRRAIEERRFAQTQLQTALQIVRLATDTRRAYFQAVAAQQSLVYMKQVDQAAQASSELAERMSKAGNWGKLEQARELAFRHEVAVQLARAEHNVNATHERLVRLLGLGDSHQALKLPERLPDLPAALKRIDEIETQALAQRLDVQVAKLDTESTAKSLGLTRATRFVNAFEVGYQNKSASNASLAEGYQVEFSLPLFDWGQARVRRAESVYMRSFYRAADVAIQARSEAREGYGSYRTNFDIARQYRDEIIPARKRISDEVLLRYNGMLSSVFELLADARAQITSINLAIDAQRDFWIAESELNFVVNGGSLTSSLTSVPAGNATPTSVPRAH